ncbi:hypothetical protein DITRI_Ditri01bG0013800 [Diplodiscus trichospermus]
MKLLLRGDKLLQRHGLALICYLAKHGSNIDLLIKAGALTALQTTGLLVAAEHPELKDLVTHAIDKLQSDHTDKNKKLDSSRECSIKQNITEQNNVVADSVRHHLKLLLHKLTQHLPRIVNLQGDRKTMPILMRCEKRFLRPLRSFTTRRIFQLFLKAKCVQKIGDVLPRIN